MDIEITSINREDLHIGSNLNKHNMAGKIAVIYRECDNIIADTVIKQIENSRNTVKRIIYPNQLLVNSQSLGDILSISEDIRFCIAIGDKKIADLAACSEREYILLLTQLDCTDYLSQSVVLDGCIEKISSRAPKEVLIDRLSMMSGGGDIVARAYAGCISHYGVLIDLWFSSLYTSADRSIIKNVDSILHELATGNICRNDEESVDIIIQANIALARVDSQLNIEQKALLLGARMLEMDYTQDINACECATLMSYYLLIRLSLACQYCGANLAMPPQAVDIASTFATRTGIEQEVVIRTLRSVDAESVIALDYVIDEYRQELQDFASNHLAGMQVSVKKLKRLYDDAGRRLSTMMDVNDMIVSARQLAVCIFGDGLIKHLVTTRIL